MPVLILSPSSAMDIVRPLAEVLLAGGGEVRCYLEEDDHELRNMGCKIAVGDLSDDVNLEAALTNVHTFVPLLPDPFRLSETDLNNLEIWSGKTAEAARAAGVSQTILMIPKLSAATGPPAEAHEEIASHFGRHLNPLAVVRTGIVWSPDRPVAAAVRALPEDLDQRKLSIITISQLVDIIAAIDDREETNGEWDFGIDRSVRELRSEAGSGSSQESVWLVRQVESGAHIGTTAASHLGIQQLA